jgi:beta-N-acetylhexosaminidase
MQTVGGGRPGRRTTWRAGLLLLAGLCVALASCGQVSESSIEQLQKAAAVRAGSGAQALTQLGADGRARERLLLMRAADWYLSRMSLSDQLGQMLLNESDGTVYSPDMAIMVAKQHIGGLIIFGDNYGTFDQTRTLFQNVQANAPIPLFIATDQEGGGITRIGQYYGAFPSPRDLGDSGSLQTTFDAGKQAALDLQQLGINTNFAPVVDVSVNGGEPWGPSRTFSDDPQKVGQFAAAFMQGEQSVGEVAAIKHFPGLGAVTEDPHLTLPVDSRPLDQIESTELVPYKMLIPQLPDMIMSTDILMPAVDPVYPAEISHAWITGILRQQLGYDGVVITDALWMDGIANTWNLGQSAVLAVLAGADIMIAAYNSYASQSVLDALQAAIADGRITPARIARSVQRILMVKIKYGMLPIPSTLLAAQPQAVQ